jgi:hypothetical protein
MIITMKFTFDGARMVVELAAGRALRARKAALTVPIAVFMSSVLGAAPAVGQSACPNSASRAESASSFPLPDCRAYEQVSPAEKNYVDSLGVIFTVRGAPSGEAVTFSSLVPFPLEGGAGEGSANVFASYLSTRAAGGWSSQSLQPNVNPGNIEEPLGVTEDLSYTLVFSGNQPPLVPEPEATKGRDAVYLRSNHTGVYRLLFQVPQGEAFSFSLVAAAAGDSRIFFETRDRLLPEALPGVPNLFEWHEGHLSLVDVLPEGSSSEGGVAGWRGSQAEYFVQNAVSEDGSRVFFTDLETGYLYVRESQGNSDMTIAVSKEAGEGGVGAEWQAATPDGSQVFYIEGGTLFRFDVQTRKREALTGEGAGVQGVLGVGGEGGSYVYFAASKVLAHGASAGAGNIYVWHEGVISLVTDQGEAIDWTSHVIRSLGGELIGPDEGVRTSRVSVDGRTLMFSSRGDPTGYDNQGSGNNCGEEGFVGLERPCDEIYVYDAVRERLTCVSCNPSGAPATRDALLFKKENPSVGAPLVLFPWDLPRNLSVDGGRVFFETEEGLAPQDINGVMDVYEWERESVGSCPPGNAGGCVFLISTGQSSEPSYFAEAGASGRDLFFFTRQPLVMQDNDELIDVYDAREGGGLAAQNASAPVAPCLGEACRGVTNSSTIANVPVSQVFSGPGNLPANAEADVANKAKGSAKGKSKSKSSKKKKKKSEKHRAGKRDGGSGSRGAGHGV